MAKKSSAAALPRVPPELDGIQVNCCRKPLCENFGTPARTGRIARGRRPRGQNVPPDPYRVHGLGRRVPGLLCRSCKRVVPIKSNQAIAEELTWITAPGSRAAACCPEPACANHGVPLPAGRYKRFGYTRHGSLRIRCLAAGCGRTFTLQRAIRRQRKPHENKTVFKALASKASVRSIAFQADLSPQAVYDKIDFIHRQCLAFAAAYERRLPDSTRDRLWTQVDRQDHIVNWTDPRDKRNVQLTALASADQASGLVFSCDLNFDPLADRSAIEAEAAAAGDYDGRGYAFRRHARFWLAQDLAEAMIRGDADAGRVERVRKARRRYAHDPLLGPIERRLLEAFAVADAEAGKEPSRHRRLPERGMQVRSEYTMYAHFERLRRLLPRIGKIRFCLDVDSGMRNACTAIFAREIRERRIDVFDLRVLKGMTVDFRRKAARYGREQIAVTMAKFPDLDEAKARWFLLFQAVQQPVVIGPHGEKWIVHPVPDTAEPGKAVHLVTDFGDYEPVRLARLVDRVSLHRLDNFFQQIRRKLNLLERPIATSSSMWKVWRGYSPYNPAIIPKLLDIYRVYHNYVKLEEPRTDATGARLPRRTPAMRLGLARGPIRIDDILYFTP